PPSRLRLRRLPALPRPQGGRRRGGQGGRHPHGVEAQSAKYAAGLPDNLPAHRRPLPFLFESNGSVTYFTNGLDPAPRSRPVFNFPRPETAADLVARAAQLRALLKTLPPLDETGLWRVQVDAIRNLEASLAKANPRALVQMA